jgi:hypothetical protein
MLAHKGMRDEVQKHIGKQTPRLQARPFNLKKTDTKRTGRTAKAVIVFNVLALIWAGINAKIKFGTLHKTKTDSVRIEA